MKYIIYKTIVFLLRPLFKIVFNPIVIGLDNIPSEGAVILACNHIGNLDAGSMLYGPKRVVHMLAKKELFSNKITNSFFRSMGAIPVNRSIHDDRAKSDATNVLNNKEVLGIFPEGTTNKTIGTENEVDLLEFKYGAVSFASKTGASIVPVAICGKYRVFKDKIVIIYGDAYKVSSDLEKENKKLRNKIRKLKLKGDEIYKKERNGKR